MVHKHDTEHVEGDVVLDFLHVIPIRDEIVRDEILQNQGESSEVPCVLPDAVQTTLGASGRLPRLVLATMKQAPVVAQ